MLKFILIIYHLINCLGVGGVEVDQTRNGYKKRYISFLVPSAYFVLEISQRWIK